MPVISIPMLVLSLPAVSLSNPSKENRERNLIFGRILNRLRIKPHSLPLKIIMQAQLIHSGVRSYLSAMRYRLADFLTLTSTRLQYRSGSNS